MSAEAGHFALILTFALALAQIALAFTLAPSRALVRAQARFTYFAGALVLVSFLCLMVGFVRSDFSLLVVATNSHIAKPLLYKIAALWGNHEGSLLLWVLIVCLYGAAFARFCRPADTETHEVFYIRVLAVQAVVLAAFLAFILFTSNPFTRLLPPPFEGQGLNPILQDPALAAHPPLLYIGYVGFALVFAQALAVLLGANKTASEQSAFDWARLMRLWVLVAWVFLTLGIALGSFWAYYELGWGGFWFWDPVENASLMPWLAATALLHSLMAQQRRALFTGWVLLLAIICFCLSLSGTFLVRSGVLNSVHAFANDPARGVFILLILAGFALWGLYLFARHLPAPPKDSGFALISRESSLLVQNIFLSTATAVVFLGTIYPLALDALTGDKISVGAPYFNSVFAPLILPMLIAMPFAPLLGWGKADIAAAGKRLSVAALFVAMLALFIIYVRETPPLALAAMLAALWVVAASANAWRQKIARLGWRQGASAPAHLAHIGFGIMIFAAIAASVWRAEVIVAAKKGELINIAHYTLRYDGVKEVSGKNYQSEQATLSFLGSARAPLLPERRLYDAPITTTTEAALYHRIDGTLYAVVGEAQAGGQVLRLWYHPFINFIWLGALLMALGGAQAFYKILRK